MAIMYTCGLDQDFFYIVLLLMAVVIVAIKSRNIRHAHLN